MSGSKRIHVPTAEYGLGADGAFNDEDDAPTVLSFAVSASPMSRVFRAVSVSALSPRLSAFVLRWIYDNDNRLTSVVITTATGTTTSTYLYDASGQRIYAKDVTTTGSTVVSSLTTYYPTKNYSETWDNLQNKKVKIDEHVFAGDSAVATVEYTPSASSPQSSALVPHVYYDIADQRGSTQVSTDASGNVVELSDYYAYGNVRSVSNTSTFSEQRKYIGQYHDVVTNLEYLNARYYNSNYGRFVSQDPVFLSQNQNLRDPQSLNSYSYANNNPVRPSDPNALTQYAQNGSDSKSYSVESVIISGGASAVTFGIFSSVSGEVFSAPLEFGKTFTAWVIETPWQCIDTAVRRSHDGNDIKNK